jgi:DNA-binding NarL/FixJ family response regulator
VIDIVLRGTDGIQLVKSMKAELPDLPIVILSMHDETLYALRALKAGAKAYVMKSDGPQRVVEAIRRALQGKIFVSPHLEEILIFRGVHASATNSDSPVDQLSDRELEVLRLLGRGYSTRSVAGQLNLSIKTIETHRAHIKEKLRLALGRFYQFSI